MCGLSCSEATDLPQGVQPAGSDRAGQTDSPAPDRRLSAGSCRSAETKATRSFDQAAPELVVEQIRGQASKLQQRLPV